MIKKILLALLFAAAPAFAHIPTYEAGAYPPCTDGTGVAFWVKHATTTSTCDTNTNNSTGNENLCECSNGTATVIGGSAPSSNSFETINLPSGTDPVADSPTDILNVTCAAPLTCTGTAGTDTWAFDWTSAPLVATAIDTSSEIRAIVGDEVGTGPLMFGLAPTMSDDLSCPAGGVVIKNGAGTAFTCSTAAAETFNYDPELTPASYGTGGWGEDWKGNAASQTWQWGNQGGATETLVNDGATLVATATGAATDNLRMRCTSNIPASGDFSVHALMTGDIQNTYNQYGIAFLQGTLATPTRIDMIDAAAISADNADIRADRFTNYTTFNSNHANVEDFSQSDLSSRRAYVRLDFADSGNTVGFYYSWDGVIYRPVTTGINIGANPNFLCYYSASVNASSDGKGFFDFVRLRTDSNRAYPSDATPTRLVVGGTTTATNYDPDTPPTSGLAVNDEYTGSVNSGMYQWGNQGTATVTAELDALVLSTAASGSVDRKALWYDVPGSGASDFTFTTAVTGHKDLFWPVNAVTAVGVLETGTVGTPTQMSALLWYRGSSSVHTQGMYTFTNYTGSYSAVGSAGNVADQSTNHLTYLQARYVTSTKVLSYWISYEGYDWIQVGSNRTLGAHPVKVGIFADQNTANSAFKPRFYFVRGCTSAACTTTPWPIGGSKAAVSITGVQADMGNNGSIESYGTTKIASANDDYNAQSVTSNVLLTDFRKIPPYDQYDPLRPPSTCATCDEFTDNAASLTWSCNGGTISQSYVNDSMAITKAMSTFSQDVAACTVAAPSGSWTATARISPFLPAAFAQCGLIAIKTGTQSTPTAMSACALYQNSGTGIDAREQHKTFTSYTAGDTEFGTGRQIGISSEPRWSQMRYDASADTLSCWASWDGIVWIPNGTSSAGVYTVANETSITTDPPFVGFFLDDRANSASQPDMRCEFSMLRVRTDADRNNASD